jgi:hypothetical protein
MSDKKTPKERMDDFSTMLFLLLKNEFIHETRFQEIDSIMATIYSKEAEEWAIDEELIEEEEGYPDPDFYTLFSYVEDEEQFVEDLKNTIITSVWANQYLSDFYEISQEVIAMRN